MFHGRRLHCVTVPALALMVSLSLALARAEAQTKPFKITGGAYGPDGMSLIPGTASPHTVFGQATELGHYTGEGYFQILGFTDPQHATFSLPMEITSLSRMATLTTEPLNQAR